MASSPLHPSRELQPLPLPRFHRSTHPHLVPRAPPGSDVSEAVGIVGLLIALGQIVKSLVWSGKGIELRGSEELGDRQPQVYRTRNRTRSNGSGAHYVERPCRW